MLRLLNTIRDTKEKVFSSFCIPGEHLGCNCNGPRLVRAFPSLIPVFLFPERERVIEGSSICIGHSACSLCMFFSVLQCMQTCS